MNCIQFEQRDLNRHKTFYLPNLSKVLLTYLGRFEHTNSGINFLVDFNNPEDNKKFIVGVVDENIQILNYPHG
jgi:hypothetical protein